MVDCPFKIIENIEENAFRLELLIDYDISLTFNVKDLRPYHGEDLRASFFFPNYGGLMQELLQQTLEIHPSLQKI